MSAADAAIARLRRSIDDARLLAALSAELGCDETTARTQVGETLREIAADPDSDVTVLGAVHALSPRLERPDHLAAIGDAIEDAFAAAEGRRPPVRVCISAPPQTGKTTVVQHGEALWLRRRPQDWIAHVSYGAELAEVKSRVVRDLVRRLGVELRDDSQSVKTWQTKAGGGFLARGRGGAITGQEGIKLAVLDDPYSQMTEAQSRHMRDRIDTDFRAVLMSRVHPDTSVIVQHTRFHEDDQIGRLEKEGWRIVNLTAVDEQTGESFWRSRSREFWAQVRREVGEHTWWSLYMGQPRPREGRLFREVAYYDELPYGLDVAIGIDLAYSAKSSADWSIAVVLGHDEAHGRWYVIDVVRRQCEAPVFAAELASLRRSWPHARMRWYASGPEKGTADMIRALDSSVVIDVLAPTADKLTRALPVSAAWNRGAVLLPRTRDDSPAERRAWVDAFSGVVLDFSGKGDAHDDDVDALAAAFDALQNGGDHVDYGRGSGGRPVRQYEGQSVADQLRQRVRRGGGPW